MSKFDEFMELLMAAIGDEEGRRAFVEYVHKLTPEDKAEMLAEAEQLDPEGSLEWNLILDSAEAEDKSDLDSDRIN